MIARHRMPWPAFDALCAGAADADGLAVLGAAQLSKHLLLLRLVVERVPSGGVAAEALAVLEDVRVHDRPAFDLFFGYPFVAAGLVRYLRLLREGRDPAPVAGFLARTALAAAVHAGLDVTLNHVPVTGPFHLPTLGTADALPVGDTVTLRASGGQAFIGLAELGSRHDGWTAVRSLDPGAGPGPLFDDVDPNRETGEPGAGHRVPATEFPVWRDRFSQAVALLRERHPGRAAQVSTVLRAVTPLAVLRPGQGRSASTWQAYGAVSSTLPGDALGFAVTLIHETQHSVLNGFFDLVELCDPTDRGLYYSPWRADPRPLTGLFHGCYAFAAVAEFWERERAVEDAEPRAAFEFAKVQAQLRQALETLGEARSLTEDGRYVVTRIAERLEALGTPSVHLADLAVDDHRLSWRLHVLVPDPASVEAAVKAWQAGATAPPLADTSRMTGTIETFVPNDRARRLSLIARRIPVATGGDDADQWLAEGDYKKAADGYRATIRANGDDLNAWTGLAIAGARLDEPGGRVWSHRPELVRAVHQALTALLAGPPPDPSSVANWLAAQVGGGSMSASIR